MVSAGGLGRTVGGYVAEAQWLVQEGDSRCCSVTLRSNVTFIDSEGVLVETGDCTLAYHHMAIVNTARCSRTLLLLPRPSKGCSAL